MRRAGHIAVAAVGFLVGLPLVAVVSLLVAGNTAPGRHLIERLTPRVSGGAVRVSGLSGRFPDALRIARISVADKTGVWLAIDDARLDWSPLRLVRGEVRVETLAAAHIAVARLPREPGGPAATTGGPALPLAVAVDDLRVDRLDLAVPIAGAAASLRVDGKADFATPGRGAAALNIVRLDGAGHYRFDVTLAPATLAARIEGSEPSHGLLAGIAGLADLGPLEIAASLDGPHNAEHATLALSVGPLSVHGGGTIDLVGGVANLDLSGSAPAMAPRPDLGWQAARLEAHVLGPLTAPEAAGHLDIEKLRAGGTAIDRITADIAGSNGILNLTASLAALRLPGAAPDLFAAAPFSLRARLALGAPRRPLTFALSHPLVTAAGEIDTTTAASGSVTVDLPALAPYAAAIGGIDAEGHAALTATFAAQDAATQIGADATLALTGGSPAARALIGGRATMSLRGTLRGDDVALDKFAIDGRTLHVSAAGARRAGTVALDWTAAVSDLSGLAATVAGSLSAEGHIAGTPQDLSLNARATGKIAVAGLPAEPLILSLQAEGLPASPSGKVEAQGGFAGAPLQLAASVSRRGDGTLDVALDRLQWKSASGEGRLSLAPGAVMPLGKMRLRMTRLADLTPLTGLPLAGSVDAALASVQQQGGRPQAQIRAIVDRLAVAGGAVERLTVDGRVADPVARPELALTLGADGIKQGTVTGNARLTATGSPQALALRLSSELRTAQGPATLSASGTARLAQHDLQLSALDAAYAGEKAHLLAPARVALDNGVAVDNLRLALGGATLALAGRITPTLALSMSAQNLTPALAKPFVPGLDGTGTLTLSGQLRGTPAAPEGTLHLVGRRLRLTSGSGGGLPAADIDATLALAVSTARLDARLTAGTSLHLRLAGGVPLRTAAPFDLRLTGTSDLAMLDPLLTPNGRAARGRATLDLGIAGTPAAPRASGTIRLAGGSLQDFAQGIHVTDLAGTIAAEGDTLRISQLSGHAGSGTLSLAGTVGILRPNLPVSLILTARNAQPLASDLLTATLNADLTLRGELAGALAVGGEIHVAKASITVPDSFPQGVATLDVRRRGVPPRPPPPPSAQRAIALALTIAAPQQVFVRGHGIDAEMGGTLKFSGSAAAPVVAGGFDLRHGTFNIAGQSLTFTSGKVAFGGSGIANKLDPTIDFVAQSTANNVTATLTVTGYADAPKLKLTSAPQLPQDEILGQLLFGQSVKQLSPFQLASIAQAIASLSGIGGADPLSAMRNSLGLDRLTVSAASRTGSGGGAGGATVEAGKYVAKGVFVGARQGTGGGTQAKVQIDLTKHLKLETTLGTGGTPTTGATPATDPGSSVGLTYQFEY